ncbi:MAG: NAD(+) synthase, partial [Propionibacteriaceae bacterium]|nr:NAD(+) synthase [Propionibacteriaceae bacterium]
AQDAIAAIAAASADLTPIIVVGAPLAWRNRVYNCAVVIHRGEVLGVVPKSYLPTYREFYERRWFAPGDDNDTTITVAGQEDVPFTPRQLFTAADVPGFTLHVEICEDMWVPIPPSADAALHGATVLANLSSSPITIAKAEDRKLLAASASARCLAAYVFAAAGPGESSTDLSWDGQTFVYECGELLGESERFPMGASGTTVDIDVRRLIGERLRQGSFDDNRRTVDERIRPELGGYLEHVITLDPPAGDLGLRRKVDRFPFVPDDPARLAQDCYEAYHIQVYGLAKRLTAIGPTTKAIIGISGGLDSTHALIVACKAMDLLARPRTDVLAYTMPGFATTEHTRNNAARLAAALGVTFETIDIRAAAQQLLTDMGHPYVRGQEVYDVTFENVQAGLRYDYLFRLANQRGGIVVGTGDLSELALGWCTYGVGDHMSHYGVNPGVPKTLMQHLIRWVVASGQFDRAAGEVLLSVLDTEITPELIPTKPGEKPQSTPGTIGPYELHDFTLFHVLRRGDGPGRIAFLAEKAWADAGTGEWPEGYPADARPSYDLAEIRNWLQLFYRRFVVNQFKRSTLPNGPKVTSGGALSPRGDWRMPSDVSPKLWLDELERDVPAA